MLAYHRGLERPPPGTMPRGLGAHTPTGSAGTRSAAETRAALRWLENRERGPGASVVRRLKRALVRRLLRLNAPTVFPWSPSLRGGEPAHELHRAAATLLRRRARFPHQWLWLWTKAAVWPMLATAAAVPMLLRCGPQVRDLHGQSLRAQWHDLLEAIWSHGIFPLEFYHRGVFRGRARADKALYLNEREIIALLSEADRGGNAPRVDDLQRFYVECRAAGLPVPRTLAVFHGHTIDLLVPSSSSGELPAKDIYLRPEVWNTGETGQCWRWNSQAHGWSHRGQVLRMPALLQRCSATAAGRVFLLQECLHNHPEVARFSSGGLATVRIATGLDEHGEPVLVAASLHLPSGDAGGADTPAGQLAAGVDVRAGELLPASGDFLTDGEFDTHPGTGAIITGAALPQWSAAVELVLRAHRRFRDVAFVGWEVALSGGGPVLLEASTNWGWFNHVLLAETPFAGLCLKRLEIVRRALLEMHPTSRLPRQAPPAPAPAADGSPTWFEGLGLAWRALANVAGVWRRNDAVVEAALDRMLADEAAALRRRTQHDPLDFHTSDSVRPPRLVRWRSSPGQVQIVRTIQAAIDGGYRVRLRAFARGAKGRMLVRSLEVELRRAA